MKLLEISEQYKEIERLVDEGVPYDQIKDTLDLIHDDFKQKGLAIISVIKNIESDYKAICEHEKVIKDKKTARKNQIERLKSYLLENMEKAGITRIDSPILSVRLQKSKPSVNIIDESKIPHEFIDIETVQKIVKQRILDNGGCLGAEIQEKNHVRIT